MFTDIHPKLPMRNKSVTKEFYRDKLGFEVQGAVDYEEYLMMKKENVEIHFFEFKDLDPKENYGQIYIRTTGIEELYRKAVDMKLNIPSAGHLQPKSWKQKEFSILDPDFNLLTFGERI